MEINVSKYAGFCFGVKRAVEMVGSLLEDKSNGRIYSLGDIIHNRQVMSDLADKGLTVITPNDLEALCNEASENNICTVVIRAHGIELGIENQLVELSEKKPYYRFCEHT